MATNSHSKPKHRSDGNHRHVRNNVLYRHLIRVTIAAGALLLMAFTVSNVAAQGRSTIAASSYPQGTLHLTPQQFQAMLSNRVMNVGAVYNYHHSLSDLTHAAPIIVVGHVAGNGKTHVIPQANPQVQPFTPAPKGSLLPGKAQEVAQMPAPTASPNSPSFLPDTDVPVTVFNIVVSKSVHGNLKIGAEIQVSQMGGFMLIPTYSGGPTMQRTVVFEDNALMKVGDQVILFLDSNADGTYHIISGPQGRVEVTNGQVHSSAPDIPVLHDYQNITVDSMANQIQANS